MKEVVKILTKNSFESEIPLECEDSLSSLKYHFTNSKVVKFELVYLNEEEKGVKIICDTKATLSFSDSIFYTSNNDNAYRIKTDK